jgi:hypothetical protein
LLRPLHSRFTRMHKQMEITTFFIGADPACVLNAIYTFLEHCGVLFSLTGPYIPDHIDLDLAALCHILVKPVVKKRTLP